MTGQASAFPSTSSRGYVGLWPQQQAWTANLPIASDGLSAHGVASGAATTGQALQSEEIADYYRTMYDQASIPDMGGGAAYGGHHYPEQHL